MVLGGEGSGAGRGEGEVVMVVGGRGLWCYEVGIRKCMGISIDNIRP